MNIKINDKTYSYKQIDSLYWLKENLDFLYTTESSEYYYFNNFDSHNVMGYLYDYDTAYNIISLLGNNVPSGWRLPTKTEVEDLIDVYDGQKQAGSALRSISSLWNTNTGVTNSSELSILPGGYIDTTTNNIMGIGNTARIWTSNSVNTKLAWCLDISGSNTKASLIKLDRNMCCSIRLVKTV